VNVALPRGSRQSVETKGFPSLPALDKAGSKWSELRRIQAGGVKLLVNSVASAIAGMVAV